MNDLLNFKIIKKKKKKKCFFLPFHNYNRINKEEKKKTRKLYNYSPGRKSLIATATLGMYMLGQSDMALATGHIADHMNRSMFPNSASIHQRHDARPRHAEKCDADSK